MKDRFKRMQICIACDKFIHKTRECSVCNCYIPLKAAFKKNKCPHPSGNKWNIDE